MRCASITPPPVDEPHPAAIRIPPRGYCAGDEVVYRSHGRDRAAWNEARLVDPKVSARTWGAVAGGLGCAVVAYAGLYPRFDRGELRHVLALKGRSGAPSSSRACWGRRRPSCVRRCSRRATAASSRCFACSASCSARRRDDLRTAARRARRATETCRRPRTPRTMPPRAAPASGWGRPGSSRLPAIGHRVAFMQPREHGRYTAVCCIGLPDALASLRG